MQDLHGACGLPEHEIASLFCFLVLRLVSRVDYMYIVAFDTNRLPWDAKEHALIPQVELEGSRGYVGFPEG